MSSKTTNLKSEHTHKEPEQIFDYTDAETAKTDTLRIVSTDNGIYVIDRTDDGDGVIGSIDEKHLRQTAERDTTSTGNNHWTMFSDQALWCDTNEEYIYDFSLDNTEFDCPLCNTTLDLTTV